MEMLCVVASFFDADGNFTSAREAHAQSLRSVRQFYESTILNYAETKTVQTILRRLERVRADMEELDLHKQREE